MDLLLCIPGGDTSGNEIVNPADVHYMRARFGRDVSEPDCAGAGVDGSGAVDLADFAAFQAASTGPGFSGRGTPYGFDEMVHLDGHPPGTGICTRRVARHIVTV
ncbi:MAG: hypothetical protein IH988_00410 [Planctomycetes bacterium]|nr:hypothetical protein [Planctomycetota bacterium]